MAATVGGSTPLPAPASAGVEPVHAGAERRDPRPDRRRRPSVAAVDDAGDEDDGASAPCPAGRLDVMA